jgi:hypothetical protein
MHVVTRSTVAGPGRLTVRTVPRVFLGRAGLPWPRGGTGGRIFWRMLFEFPFLRYAAVLAPFPAAALVWPELALPISGAPLVMFLVVLWIESNVLAVPDARARRALIAADEAARGLDLLAVRGRAILTRIAAGRDLRQGGLVLVVEQSGMARVPPLTLVSVQSETPPAILDLTADEITTVRGLFDAALDERLLLRINLSENRTLRTVRIEAAGVSAHARLAALARAAAISAPG